MLIGIFWGFFSRQASLVALAGVSLFFLLLDQTRWANYFFSQWYFTFMMNVPLGRYLAVTKLIGFVLVGGMARTTIENGIDALTSIWRFVYSELETACYSNPFWGIVSAWIRSLGLILVLVFIAPTLRFAGEYVQSQYMQPLDQISSGYPQHPPYAKNIEQAMQQIQALDPGPGAESFFRPFSFPKIGVQTNTVESSIPFRFGYGIVTPFYTPTMLLTTRSAKTDENAAQLSGLKYTLALDGVERQLIQQPGMEILFRFGEVCVLKHHGYAAIPVQLLHAPQGKCEIVDNRFNRVALRLSGLSQESWIRIGISRYRKWRAFANGTEIPIIEHIEVGESGDVGRYISVYMGNGTLELRYAPQSMDWLFYGLSILCGIVLLILVWNPRLYRWSALEFPQFESWVNLCRTPRFRTLFIGMLGILVLGILGILEMNDSSRETHFWYGGILTDIVSPKECKSDGLLDLGFALSIGSDLKGKILQSITLQEMGRDSLTPSSHRWTTGEEKGVWKVAILPFDENPAIWNRVGESLAIPLHPPHFLTLFASNPHRGEYIPTGTRMELTLHFENGDSASFQCPLLPQGTH